MKPIDWDLAVSLGSRLAGDGPEIGVEGAAPVIEELRAGATRSAGLVREFTGLVAPEDTAPVLIVNRRGWIQANADGFARLLDPVLERLAISAETPSGSGWRPSRPGNPDSRGAGARVAGAQLGLMLGFLGGKVLGQFDPFFPPSGRLLLVAPNIVQVERELGAGASDFRLWVCLHEETHRVQFTAVPWLRDHVFAEMNALLDTVQNNSLMADGLKRLAEAFRGDGGSLVELMSSPEQAEIMDRLTGVMSLLEGHADVVMDGVGPSVIGSVADIRRKFDRRRKGASSLDRWVRRVLGLEAKMAQYRDGAAFVRSVVEKIGMADFNAIWATPDNLPSKAEIGDPEAWVRRVHP
ncbi:MAG: zinc-dependent metalloprotease [Nocardioides sp.]